jgi:hypothetical protein
MTSRACTRRHGRRRPNRPGVLRRFKPFDMHLHPRQRAFSPLCGRARRGRRRCRGRRPAARNYIFFYEEPKFPGSGFGTGLVELLVLVAERGCVFGCRGVNLVLQQKRIQRSLVSDPTQPGQRWAGAFYWPGNQSRARSNCSATYVAGGASKGASTELNRMAQFPGRA